MRTIVCLKPVLDPEIPPRSFRVDEQARKPVVVGVPAATVMDSYAENALETAIQLRDRIGSGKVTVLCVGDDGAEDVLRRALAFTADEAVRVWDPGWTDLDGLSVAHLLAAAIQELGGADLVLCGRQAADVEEGVVGPAIAAELGLPCVTVGRSIEPVDGTVRVQREMDGLLVTVEVSPPVVVTMTSSEQNVPRMPKVKDTMLARRKPIRLLGPDRLRIDPARATPGMRLERLSLPAMDGECDILAGPGADPPTGVLIQRLQELKIF